MNHHLSSRLRYRSNLFAYWYGLDLYLCHRLVRVSYSQHCNNEAQFASMVYMLRFQLAIKQFMASIQDFLFYFCKCYSLFWFFLHFLISSLVLCIDFVAFQRLWAFWSFWVILSFCFGESGSVSHWNHFLPLMASLESIRPPASMSHCPGYRLFSLLFWYISRHVLWFHHLLRHPMLNHQWSAPPNGSNSGAWER